MPANTAWPHSEQRSVRLNLTGSVCTFQRSRPFDKVYWVAGKELGQPYSVPEILQMHIYYFLIVMLTFFSAWQALGMISLVGQELPKSMFQTVISKYMFKR